MAALPWTPWHKVIHLRDDLKSGELSLATFAADLYDVSLGRARPIYQDPKEFFALTYPTFNLRELARDVVGRLAGQNDKAVRQLTLTYGGGKTHSLITLFHLANDPAHLPHLPAVQEFVQHIGMTPPRAHIAVLAFDRLDPVKGMEVRAPDGTMGRFKYPWTVLAFQLGGAEGLRILGSEGEEEREEPPFTNVLEDLLRLPSGQDLATLVLIDEVLMWARTKAGADPIWRDRLQDFFQCLTQAATKIDNCAVVASLLATDPRKSDTLGKQIAGELFAIFRREQEEAVEPVGKEDVAEVLRRRFFTPESIRDRESFRPHVVAALQGIAGLDEQTAKERQSAEERFVKSYPFHPELTEVFYSKWTNLDAFQRTRGVLRTFALALRAAEHWDNSPLIAANIFLSEPGKEEISEAARELATVAASEEFEGKKPEWAGILTGELDKAREVQRESASLRHREIEQAVLAIFLHSQPVGKKAQHRELMLLLGATRPDKIELEKALRRWGEVSWFLDEQAFEDAPAGPEGQRSLPKYWRLGFKPNLRQMHDDACQNRVTAELVEIKLLDEIGRLKSLTAGASAAGARVHNLPEKPSDIGDDGEFHYAILGPRSASDPGKPSAEARRFIDETTASDRPRVYRNAIVLVVPARDGLEAARGRVRDYLGWEEVRMELAEQNLQDNDAVRWQILLGYLDEARKKSPEAIRQAYGIVVTVSAKNEVEAFKVTVGSGEPLFNLIKADGRSRIQDTPINAEALLPGGPYDLWREGETSRRVKDLVGAFAQFPTLPKMLNTRAILDTLVHGCMEGFFVFRLLRPDRSARTFWREVPDEVALKEPGLELVLLDAASLTDLAPALLVPGVLPGLWANPEIALGDLYDYFSGSHKVKVQRGGYEESVQMPRAAAEVLQAAVRAAVQQGKLWLTSGPASILGEEIPAGLLTDDARLQGPPAAVSPMDLVPDRLPEAWTDDITTALAISVALSKKAGKTLPWATICEAIDGAMRIRLLETTVDSGPWPCDATGAQYARLRLPGAAVVPPIPPAPPKPGVWVGEAELESHQIQDLADAVSNVLSAAAGYDLTFRLQIEVGGASPLPDDVAAEINGILQSIKEDFILHKDPLNSARLKRQ